MTKTHYDTGSRPAHTPPQKHLRMKSHEHAITVRRQPGQGTTFHFCSPVCQSVTAENARAAEIPRQRHGIGPRQIGDAAFAVSKMLKNATPRLVGQCRKGAVQHAR